MLEKSPEKTVLESGKPVTTGVLRFEIQGMLLQTGKKGLSVKEIGEALAKMGFKTSRMSIHNIIVEMKLALPPLMYVETVQRRTGPNKFPVNYHYITRYKK